MQGLNSYYQIYMLRQILGKKILTDHFKLLHNDFYQISWTNYNYIQIEIKYLNGQDIIPESLGFPPSFAEPLNRIWEQRSHENHFHFPAALFKAQKHSFRKALVITQPLATHSMFLKCTRRFHLVQHLTDIYLSGALLHRPFKSLCSSGSCSEHCILCSLSIKIQKNKEHL